MKNIWSLNKKIFIFAVRFLSKNGSEEKKLKPRIRRALARAGRLNDAWLVQHGTMANQQVARLSDVPGDACPYFAIVLVHGQGRRPEAAPC